jgi:hypothetical protein
VIIRLGSLRYAGYGEYVRVLVLYVLRAASGWSNCFRGKFSAERRQNLGFADRGKELEPEAGALGGSID